MPICAKLKYKNGTFFGEEMDFESKCHIKCFRDSVTEKGVKLKRLCKSTCPCIKQKVKVMQESLDTIKETLMEKGGELHWNEEEDRWEIKLKV